MAHIRRHPKSRDRWQVRYRDPSGRERSKNFSRKAEAEKFLVTVEADKLRGAWTDPRLGQTTLEEWARRYMATRAHLKPSTLAGYRSLLRSRIVPTFGHTPIGKIDTMAVAEWMAEMLSDGLSTSRTRQAYHLLGAMLDAAVRSGYLARNPASGLDLPRLPRKDMLFLDAEGLERLAQAVENRRDRAAGTLIHLLGYGGLRWGEAAALKRARCHLLRNRVEVAEALTEVGGYLHFGEPKTYQRRMVAIPDFLRDRLAEHLVTVAEDPEALVFTGARGGPLRRSNFAARTWRPAVRAAGLPDSLRIHDLRHTAASLLISSGAHPKEVQAHLGHSSISVTHDRYGHLFPTAFDGIAERLEEVHRRISRGHPADTGAPNVLALRPKTQAP